MHRQLYSFSGQIVERRIAYGFQLRRELLTPAQIGSVALAFDLVEPVLLRQFCQSLAVGEIALQFLGDRRA